MKENSNAVCKSNRKFIFRIFSGNGQTCFYVHGLGIYVYDFEYERVAKSIEKICKDIIQDCVLYFNCADGVRGFFPVRSLEVTKPCNLLFCKEVIIEEVGE